MIDPPKPFRLYRLEQIHAPGKYLAAKTSTGGMAAMLFTTREKAQRFVDAEGLVEECKLAATDPRVAIGWLRTVLKAGEASDVALDPDPELSDQSSRYLAIFEILMRVEGLRKGPWWIKPTGT